MRSAWVVSVAAVGVVALAACGGAGDDAGGDPTAGPSVPASSAATDLGDRCTDAEGTITTVEGPDDETRIAVGELGGSGPVAAVYLHQTVQFAMCGWAPYAAEAAGQGVAGYLVDVCDYGDTTCSDVAADDVASWLTPVVQHARDAGATRVVVVGASMGGSLALGAGQQAGADAIIDLSGPPSWRGVPGAVKSGAQVTVPLVVAGAPGDMDLGPLKKAVRAAPSKEKAFVEVKGAEHGWDLVATRDISGDDVSPMNVDLTPLGTALIGFMLGELPATSVTAR